MANSSQLPTMTIWIRFYIICMGICLLLCFSSCNDDSVTIDIDDFSTPDITPADDERVKGEIDRFCGDCHAPPPASALPRDGWFKEVELGFTLYEESGRTDLKLPKRGEIVDYYRRHAPAKLSTPPTAAKNPPGSVKFSESTHPLPAATVNQSTTFPPAISNLQWYDKADTEWLPRSTLVVCEMRAGAVYEVHFDGTEITYGRQAKVAHPSHTTLVDLDRDGQGEYLVADLGSFLPEDHAKGQVIWLRPQPDTDAFDPVALVTGLGRVTDIQPGDFNQDGKTDLLVAEFGWRLTGNVWLLINTGIKNGIPQYDKQLIDDRHGVIHIPVTDINGDGHLDFVSLISQEHESIELFINRGDGTFRRKKVFSAENPVWGSTGIDLYDMDHDGDLDILFTNGDIFDTFYIVPYQAAHWIENLGDLQWKTHVLHSMPGIHRAIAGDLDHDGDEDVVCCSLIGPQVLQDDSGESLDSIIWLEQTAPGKFTARAIESDNAHHATAVMGDFDQDGDLDIATAQFDDEFVTPRRDISIWWNNSIIQR